MKDETNQSHFHHCCPSQAVPPGGEHQLTGGAEQLLVPEERNTANATFSIVLKGTFCSRKKLCSEWGYGHIIHSGKMLTT